MTLNKNEIIRLKADVKVTFNEASVVLTCGSSRVQHSVKALKVLEVFCNWISIEDGIKALSQSCADKAEYLQLTSLFHQLLRQDFFRFKQDRPPVFGFRNGHFDSFPVHLRMLNDKTRSLAFQQAIRQTVTERDIVLDIGTGNGILAATAAMCGAKHVYAVERTDFIEVARAVFKANGLEDRITLIKGDSTEITLPEKATVLVSEIIGNDPFQEGILRTFNDAKKRLLTPDARVIPQDIRVFALALQCDEEKYHSNRLTPEALANWQQWYGIDFSAFLEFYSKDELTRISRPSADARNWKLLSSPVELTRICLRDPDNKVETIEQQMTITASGSLNAVLVYFETTVGEGVTLSMHPRLVDCGNSWVSPLFFADRETVSPGDAFTLSYSLNKLKTSLKLARLDPSGR